MGMEIKNYYKVLEKLKDEDLSTKDRIDEVLSALKEYYAYLNTEYFQVIDKINGNDLKNVKNPKGFLENALNALELYNHFIESIMDNSYAKWDYGELNDLFMREKDLVKCMSMIKSLVDHKDILLEEQEEEVLKKYSRRIMGLDYISLTEARERLNAAAYKSFKSKYSKIKRDIGEFFDGLCLRFKRRETRQLREDIAYEKGKDFIKLILESERKGGGKSNMNVTNIIENIAKRYIYKSGMDPDRASEEFQKDLMEEMKKEGKKNKETLDERRRERENAD